MNILKKISFNKYGEKLLKDVQLTLKHVDRFHKFCSYWAFMSHSNYEEKVEGQIVTIEKLQMGEKHLFDIKFSFPDVWSFTFKECHIGRHGILLHNFNSNSVVFDQCTFANTDDSLMWFGFPISSFSITFRNCVFTHSTWMNHSFSTRVLKEKLIFDSCTFVDYTMGPGDYRFLSSNDYKLKFINCVFE